MRKIIATVVNLVNLILLGIAFGLGSLTAAVNANDASIGTYYSLVWPTSQSYFSAMNIAGFFVFCVAAGIMLFLLIPLKVRKFVAVLEAILLVFAGVATLLVPQMYCSVADPSPLFYLQGGLIAMAVLMFVAALLTVFNVVLEFTEKAE